MIAEGVKSLPHINLNLSLKNWHKTGQRNLHFCSCSIVMGGRGMIHENPGRPRAYLPYHIQWKKRKLSQTREKVGTYIYDFPSSNTENTWHHRPSFRHRVLPPNTEVKPTKFKSSTKSSITIWWFVFFCFFFFPSQVLKFMSFFLL